MFADPTKNLKSLRLRENMIVVDLGAGTGFYSLAAAHIVTSGKVYAIEVIRDYVAVIGKKAKEAHLNNVEAIWGNVEKVGGTKVRNGLADAVIASNILFQVEDKDKFLEEIKRILKPSGEVLLIDWSDSPAAGTESHSLITKSKAKEMFEQKGFMFLRDIDAGAHHYGMILKKKQ